jgi:RNA exonuclease 4
LTCFLHISVPPKLKNLQKENISSNWKNLMGSIASTSNRPAPKPHPPATQPRLPPKKQPSASAAPKSKTDEKDEIWFDDVDESLLEQSSQSSSSTSVATPNGGLKKTVEASLVKEKSFAGMTRIVGMDCEMVGVGRDGVESVLARVSIVNHFGNILYDTFVAPREAVTDYRTHVSGVRPADLAGAPHFKEVQQRVSELLKGRILVGHALKHDMRVLFLDHPKRMLRDTSGYKPFRYR